MVHIEGESVLRKKWRQIWEALYPSIELSADWSGLGQLSTAAASLTDYSASTVHTNLDDDVSLPSFGSDASDLDSTFEESTLANLTTFLSACSSGQNKGKDLSGESLHMIGAMQMAGFRHVIGTLGEIFDRPCIEVAETFYETLQRRGGLTNDAVALGLHLTVRKLRNNKADEFGKGRPKVFVDDQLVGNSPTVTAPQLLSIVWLPYVHFGP